LEILTSDNTKATQKPEQAKVLRPSQTRSLYHSSYGYDVELLNLCEKAYIKKNQDSYNKVFRWMGDNKGNVERLRNAAIHTNSQKQTPLHLLVAATPPLYLIESFMEHSPDATKLKDRKGRLPLHYASQSLLSIDILNLLINAYSDSINIRDYVGNLPMDFPPPASNLKDLLGVANFSKTSKNVSKERKKKKSSIIRLDAFSR